MKNWDVHSLKGYQRDQKDKKKAQIEATHLNRSDRVFSI